MSVNMSQTTVMFIVVLLAVSNNPVSCLKITKLSVPELVQSNSSSVTLDCEFAAEDERFSLSWLLDRQVVYQWRPRREAHVLGLLEGRIDKHFNVSVNPLHCGRALRIPTPSAELSGQYTCLLRTDSGAVDERTSAMLVYNPENEFMLKYRRDDNITNVYCYARGLYPQPYLVLESNRQVVPRQEQRVWRSEGVLYDAECRGHVATGLVATRVICRLSLPHAGYAAMRELVLHAPERTCRSRGSSTIFYFNKFLMLFICALVKFP